MTVTVKMEHRIQVPTESAETERMQDSEVQVLLITEMTV